jgi:hypothetical protein
MKMFIKLKQNFAGLTQNFGSIHKIIFDELNLVKFVKINFLSFLIYVHCTHSTYRTVRGMLHMCIDLPMLGVPVL